MKKQKNKVKNKIENQSCKTCSGDLVEIRSDAFAFCRYSIMVLVWIAFFFRLKWLVLVVFAILAFSAIFTVKYSPMILIYQYTFGFFYKSKTEPLAVDGMRFAHILGTVLAGIAVLFLFFLNTPLGWGFTLFLAIMKTVSAVGLCPAYKLYNCMKSGGCCSFSRALNNVR
jgi:hypothetical protein